MGSVVLGNFILAVAVVLKSLLNIYFWIVLIGALLSWVSPDPRNPIVRFIYAMTEPALDQIRRRLPFVLAGGIDFSPLVLMLAIQFIQIFLVQSLYQLAFQVSAARLGWFG